ncbi:MAG: hydrolase [Gammaproteobacteria bacterium]
MIVESEFHPNRFLKNRHLQTLVPNVLFRRAKPVLRRERLELPDGDFVDVDWTSRKAGPIVIVLHGLEGSIRSRYAAAIMQRIDELGFRGALIHFRGCSGEPNRLPIGYHSGFTQDLEYFSGLLKQREPDTLLAAIGYSLGGNALLKWLGESPNANRLVTGVAVSVPFDLADASRVIEQGMSQLYKWNLLGRMKRSSLQKFANIKAPYPLPDIRRIHTFREFDDQLTAPLHGYKDADDYYRSCSSRFFLKNIRVPTLILHSADDPFMSSASLPIPDELSDAVTLELSQHGGHVGSINGSLLRPNMWLVERISRHLQQILG